MGTFPVIVDIQFEEYPVSKGLLGVKVEPPKFNAAYALTDFYKRSWKVTTDLGKCVHETMAKMNKALEGVKSDMKKSTEMELNCEVNRIIFNPPATIVFWKDGSKTVVKCHGDQTFNPYYGFCAALAKHIYKSNSAVNRMVDKYVSEMTHDSLVKYSDSYMEDSKKTNDDGYVGVITNEDKSQTVNSLQYDHNLGRYCENCKYVNTFALEYPCNKCTHNNYNETQMSYWASDSEKKNKKVDIGDTNGDNIEKTPKKNSRNVKSIDDDYIIGRFCNTCKYQYCNDSSCPCLECIHTGKDTGISYWTKKEDK